MKIQKILSTTGNRLCAILFIAVFCLLQPSLSAWAQDDKTSGKVLDGNNKISPDTRSLDTAIEAARHETVGDQATPAAHTRLGYLLLSKGALNEAMDSFEAALQLNPRYHEAQTGKGIVLARKGDLRQAEQVLKKALLLNPDPVRTHYELGLVYEKLGNFSQAIREFKEGIKKYQQGRR